MRALLIFAAMFMFTIGTSLAQNPKAFYKTPYKSRNSGSFNKGINIFSVGYGFPNQSGPNNNTPGWIRAGRNDRHGFGPVYLKFEHGIMDEIGVGLYNATAVFNQDYWVGGNEYRDNGFATSFGFLGYYHFNKLIPVSKLDVYAGVGGGFRIVNYKYDYTNKDDSDVDAFPVAKVGARYYFNRTFGVYGELGYDKMSTANLGISLRF